MTKQVRTALPGAGLRVLFVDDDAAVVDSLARLLAMDGFEVDSASNAEAGLALARSGFYDAILLDMRLPGMPDLEVLRRLRAEGIRTPVLILTGFPSADSAFDARGLGAVGYLTKSMISGAELATALRKAAATAKPRMLRIRPLFSPFRPGRSERISALLRELQRIEGSADSGGGAATDSGRADLQRALARTVANRDLTFLEFVVGAKALHFVLSDPSLPVSAAIPTIREWLDDASDRSAALTDPAVDQILARLEGAGRNWSMLTEAEVAAAVDRNSHRLWQLLVENLGLTFPKCRRAIVMRRAVLELWNTDEHVRQVAFLVGYDDAGHFDRDFRDLFGVTPTGFRGLRLPHGDGRSR